MTSHGTCIHFNGVQNKLCKRGVAYSNWDGPKPCIQFMEKSARGGTYLRPGEQPAERKPFPGADKAKPCPFYEEPTDEQVQADRAEADAALKRTIAAIEVAGKWRVKPKPASDRHEVVECPVCKGRLHLSQSAYNGHVHGKCETEGCVSWME
jgi:hypothetical protein